MRCNHHPAHFPRVYSTGHSKGAVEKLALPVTSSTLRQYRGSSAHRPPFKNPSLTNKQNLAS